MKTIEQIEIEKGTFDIGLALSNGWAYVSKFLMFYILGGFIVVVIGGLSGIIPFAGGIANSLILTPCFTAGAIYVTWNISNNKPWTEFGDMFKGFNLISPLVVSTLIQLLLLLGIFMLAMASYIPEMISIFKLSSGGGALTNQEELKEIMLSMLSAKTIILFSLCLIITLIISIIWAFKYHFIVIYKLQGWAAMELSRKVCTKNFFQLLGLFIILGFAIVISILPCGLGLFFTLPWMIGAIYSAFAQITHCDQDTDNNREGFDFLKSTDGDDL